MVKTGVILTAFTLALMAPANAKAQNTYNDANTAYRAHDFAKAVELFTAVIARDAEATDLQPAYFFLANSLDNLYTPSKKGEAGNDALLKDAVKYYRIAADRLNTSGNPEHKKLAKISQQYLVSVYADKLNDPATAEQLLRDMIQADASDLANYFTLAHLYEDTNEYVEAERTLQAAKSARPNDPATGNRLAAFYNRHPER